MSHTFLDRRDVELLVDGYIHEFEKECTEKEVPTEINGMCLNYFYLPPFDRFSNTMNGAAAYAISDDGLSAMLTDKVDVASLFGEHLIESMDNETIYSWTFKIIEQRMYLGIGIAAEFEDVNDFDYYENNYVYNCSVGALKCNGMRSQYQYGPVLNANDKIEMVFDVGKGHLSFIINDKPIDTASEWNTSNIAGIACNNVRKSKDLKYRMAICIYLEGDGVELISFSQSNPARNGL